MSIKPGQALLLARHNAMNPEELLPCPDSEMNNAQCNVCGVGFYLPSDVCDHCNQPLAIRQNTRTPSKAEEDREVIYKPLVHGVKEGEQLKCGFCHGPVDPNCLTSIGGMPHHPSCLGLMPGAVQQIDTLRTSLAQAEQRVRELETYRDVCNKLIKEDETEFERLNALIQEHIKDRNHYITQWENERKEAARLRAAISAQAEEKR